MNEELIAPCGMNCGICSSYLALKHEIKAKGVRIPYCSGCRPRGKTCAFIKKRCEFVSSGRVKYCYECYNFPCDKLKRLDSTYKTKFKMSMVDNLKFMREYGTEKFLNVEQEKWQCPACGGVICCHNGLCFNCNLDELKSKKEKFRWG